MLAALAATAIMAVLLGSVGVAHAAATGRASTPTSRANAVRDAKDYLRFEAFSLKGLAHQLRFDGFSGFDARYGARHSGANWMKQAVRAAKDYLRTEPFSRSGMVRQLEFDGFTARQARHGAIRAGL
ncbi:MAG TPA: Ltp family lipoprotein [Gaiellaceae bacterium]|nr:Ltp family lipoprotein [Gaiellaceae bacterium]